MNWTDILQRAGIPEPIGRIRAIEEAQKLTAERYAATGGPKRAHGTNTRSVTQVNRKVLQEQERRRNEAH